MMWSTVPNPAAPANCDIPGQLFPVSSDTVNNQVLDSHANPLQGKQKQFDLGRTLTSGFYQGRDDWDSLLWYLSSAFGTPKPRGRCVRGRGTRWNWSLRRYCSLAMVYGIEEVTGYVSGVQAHGAIHCLRCLTDGVLNFPQAVTAVFEVSGVQESYPRGQSEASCPEVRNCTHRMEKLSKGQSVASLCSAPLYSYVVFTFFFFIKLPRITFHLQTRLHSTCVVLE